MAFRRGIATINWKYGLGELALIIVGVSIALAANSWYQNEVERQLEREALFQLKTELQADLEVVREHHNDLKEFEGFVSLLLEHIRSDESYTDEMQRYFEGITSWRGVRFRSASYEEIKNHGFSLISDPELRARVIDLYEGQFPALIGTTRIDSEFTRNRILPYIFERFRRDSGAGWIPLDYSELRSDPVYANIVMSKQARLRNRLLPRQEVIIDAIVEVIEKIDKELATIKQ